MTYEKQPSTFNKLLRTALVPLAALTITASCSSDTTAVDSDEASQAIDYGCVPAGSEIVFSSDRDGDYELYRTDENGLVQLTDNDATDWNPQYSSKKDQLVFYSNASNEDDRYDAVLMPARTDETNVFDAIVSDPEGSSINDATFADDGEAVLVKIRNDIHRASSEGSVNLTGDLLPNHEEWKPVDVDGGIYFTARPIESNPVDSTNEIYFLSDDGNLTQLTKNKVSDWYTEVIEQTGEIVFISQRDGGLDQIFIMNADGSNKRQLTTAQMLNGGEGADPSPVNEDCLLFITTSPKGQGGYDIATLRISTGEVTILNSLNSSAEELSPIVIPDSNS